MSVCGSCTVATGLFRSSCNEVFMPALMKLSPLLFLLVSLATPAHAQRFTRVKGILRMTYFADSLGATLADLPFQSRRIVISERISRSPAPGIRQTCSENRAMKQRVCMQRYNYEVQGQGSCAFRRKVILNNWAPSSRRLQAYLEGTVSCPSGYSAYLLASGELTRS